jgi:hypothetical protein
VGGGDGPDDGQAEAMAGFVMGPARVEALERLEQPANFAARDDLSGIGHR